MSEAKKPVSLAQILRRGTSISDKNVVKNNGREEFIKRLPEGLTEDLVERLGVHKREFSKDFTESQSSKIIQHMRKNKEVTNMSSSFEVGGDTYEVAITRPDGDGPHDNVIYLAGIDSRVTMRANEEFDDTRNKLPGLWTCDESEYDDE